MSRKVRLNEMRSEEDAKFDELTRKYPEGIPVDEYLEAFDSPEENAQIKREANELFVKFSRIHGDSLSEDDVWEEVWRVMDNRHSKGPEKPHPSALNTDTYHRHQRGSGFGRQEQKYGINRVSDNDRF